MEAIRHLIHFYNNENFLFQTVTMYEEDEREEIFNSITDSRSWYWGRYSVSDRIAYMNRRVAVEKMLYAEFKNKHWILKNENPVYLYLIPNISLEKIDIELSKRRKHGEHDTRYLLFDLQRISNRSDITFTLDDSLRSYRKKLLNQGIKCRELKGKIPELKDYGQIFHIDKLEDMYNRNIETDDLCFEIQVWDKNILKNYMKEQISEKTGCRNTHPSV